MTHVLYVNHTGSMSGAEHSLLTLVCHLDRSEFEPHVAAPPGPLLDACAKLGVATHPLSLEWFRRSLNPVCAARQLCRLASGRRALRRLVGELRPAIIHANGLSAQLYVSGLFGRGAWRTVWHLRDMRPLSFVGPYLARRADALIATSRALAQFYPDLSSRPIEVIHNGVDLTGPDRSSDAPAVRAALGVQEGETLFVCIGQALAWKRHEDLVAAMRLLADEPIRVVLVRTDPFGHGEGLDVGALPPRLTVLPEYTDIAALLAACDVLAHPSRNEPFGRTVLEAMAASRPTIVTDSGGPPEIAVHEETGLIVRTGDVESLAEAMRRLAHDPGLRARLGAAGRRRAEELFSAPQHARLVEHVYGKLLGASPSAPG